MIQRQKETFYYNFSISHKELSFSNLLIPPFLIHDSNNLFCCLNLLAFVATKIHSHLLISGNHFLVNQTFILPVKCSHDNKSLIDLSGSSLLLAWTILQRRDLTSSAIWLIPCSDLFVHPFHGCSRWKLQLNALISGNNSSNTFISFSSKSTIPNFGVTVGFQSHIICKPFFIISFVSSWNLALEQPESLDLF